MPTVISCSSSYNYETLRPQVFGMLERLDQGRIVPGCKVLIKPNFLAPAPPEAAMITHPLILRAVAEYVISKGVRPLIADSQAMGTFNKVLRTGGYLAAMEGLDVEFREFRSSRSVDIGEPFGAVEISADALDADLIINLPKLKTHSQMSLTLGVKNMFGCIVGLRKPQWHFRAGVDKALFAKLLVRIYAAVRPQITILDGILAMEGQGPGRSGLPKELNVLMASDNAVALDMAVCRMLGVSPDYLLTNRIAAELGLAPEYSVEGELQGPFKIRLPLSVPLVFGPRRFHSLIRKYLVQRPVVIPSRCRLCGECWKICPAKSVNAEKDYVVFDYEKCIRCYCCIEVCPYAALTATVPLAGRIFSCLIKR